MIGLQILRDAIGPSCYQLRSLLHQLAHMSDGQPISVKHAEEINALATTWQAKNQVPPEVAIGVLAAVLHNVIVAIPLLEEESHRDYRPKPSVN